MQFTEQHQFYQERYTKTDFLIILRDAVPVGRLSVARWQDEIRLGGYSVAVTLPQHWQQPGLGAILDSKGTTGLESHSLLGLGRAS